MMGRKPPNSGRQDTMQRIQVGVVGLAAVLLLVSVANFIIQRASDEQTVIEEMQAEAAGAVPPVTTVPEGKPAEPLAELGITPAPASGGGKAEAQNPAANLPGQTVPDLRPDPNLGAPMDREQR
ncbi:hypothetical protein [uncultured Parasphingorhabdus sp.]|uniref:hypothetical protein n=1 Tax=uncultured Parasphingorhabdus sp. TaxID=2709694 RepID=UPI002AA7A41D|nr:hypothetical protein [uncultured Parasphingorhabdus sp.]